MPPFSVEDEGCSKTIYSIIIASHDFDSTTSLLEACPRNIKLLIPQKELTNTTEISEQDYYSIGQANLWHPISGMKPLDTEDDENNEEVKHNTWLR